MLDACREYGEAHDILFNVSKANCMFVLFLKLIIFCIIKIFTSWGALYDLLINDFFLFLYFS